MTISDENDEKIANSQNHNQDENNSNQIIYKTGTFSKLVEEMDVEGYLKQTEEELQKIQYSLNQRMFSEAILNLLDKLVDGNSFSRLIFLYILDSAHISRDSSIMLLDFFRAYFVIYEGMKKDKIDLAKKNSDLIAKTEKYQKKLNKHKIDELVLDKDLTNNSKIKFELLHINPFTLQNKNSEIYSLNLFLDQVNSKEIEISQKNVKTKFIIPIKSLCSIVNLEISKNQFSNREIVIKEEINFQEIFESNKIKKFIIPNQFEIEIDLVYIQSKINYYLKIVNTLEIQKSETTRNLNTLSQSIMYLEQPFPKLFSVSKTNIKNYQNELEVSEKIERYILKIIGKNLILWEKVFFLVNKIMSVLMFCNLLYKSDFPNVLICFFIYGFELSMIEKKNFSKILIVLSFSWIYDSIWFFFYLSKWDIAFIQEVQETGFTYRKISVVTSALIILIKLILIFSVWRLALTEKVKQLNPSKKFIAKKQIYERFINENLTERKSHGTYNISDI